MSFRLSSRNCQALALGRRYKKIPEASDVNEYQSLPLPPTRYQEILGKRWYLSIKCLIPTYIGPYYLPDSYLVTAYKIPEVLVYTKIPQGKCPVNTAVLSKPSAGHFTTLGKTPIITYGT
jgi:hypothetical protein